MRLAWVTDIHATFVDPGTWHLFLQTLDDQADAVVISGDIAESRDVGDYLRAIERRLQRPIYFVLGNHDFYRGSIAATRNAVAQLAGESEYLVYLTAGGFVELTPDTALIGHDGWADGRLGNFDRSDVVLNDYLLIEELRHWKPGHVLDKQRLRATLEILGDDAARHLEAALMAAAAKYRDVIAVTHVPPFREAAWYQGRMSDDNFLPHFASKAAGDVLLRVMEVYPQCNLLVVCGHTHGGGEFCPLANLRVLTGDAEYRLPRIQQVFEVT